MCTPNTPIFKKLAKCYTRFIISLLMILSNQVLLAQDSPHSLEEIESQILMIQFPDSPDQAAFEKLRKNGVKLLSYYGKHTYSASFDQTDIESLISNAFIVLDREDATNKYAAGFMTDTPSFARVSEIRIAVWLEISLDKKTLAEFSRRYHLQIEKKSGRLLIGQISPDHLRQLAQSPLVNRIDEMDFEIEALIDRVRSIHHINTVQSQPQGMGLSGKGIVVGVGDAGQLGEHIDFTDRVLATTGVQTSLIHPEHVSGIIGGAGLLDPNYRGVAPAVDFVIEKYFDIILKTPELIGTYGMSISNNSYGPSFTCETSGELNGLTNLIDEQLHNYPQLLHVFAAGNEGHRSCYDYPPGFGTILRYFPAAKNVLTVGSIRLDHQIAHNSSKGPTADGRLKPELCAMGVGVMSASNGNNYQLSSGTSMAAPVVSGAAALLSEYYQKEHAGELPPGALLKAVLCNSAEDLGNKGPDYTYGFGKLNVLRAWRTLEQERYQEGRVAAGETYTSFLEVPAGMQRLKVTLYWADEVANLSATQALTQDLDLKMIDQSGKQWQPWVLNPQAQFVDQLAVRGVDRLNNIEQFTLDLPEAGTWQIEVEGHALPMGEQPFFVVYEFVEAGVELTFPTSGAVLAGGEEIILSWDNGSNEQGSYTLEYSTDGGNSWTVIDDSVPANSGQYGWEVPGDDSHEVLVRITDNQSGSQSVNETPLAIVEPVLDFEVYSDCNRRIVVSCMPHSQAAEYELMVLEGSEMRVIQSSTTPEFTFESNLLTGREYWMAIRIVTEGGLRAERSRAVNIKIPHPIPSSVDLKILSDANCNGEASGSAEVIGEEPSQNWTYHWSNGETGAIATRLAAGSHEVRIINEEGCEWFNSFNIGQPEALLVESNITQAGNQLSNGAISVTVAGGTPPYQFSWKHDQSIEQGDLENLAPGIYELTLTDSNNCSLVEVFTIDFLDSTTKSDSSFSYTVYPNPATDFVVCDIRLKDARDIHVQLIDLNGRVIFRNSQGKHRIWKEKLDVSDLVAGVYVLRIRAGEIEWTPKIMISGR